MEVEMPATTSPFSDRPHLKASFFPWSKLMGITDEQFYDNNPKLRPSYMRVGYYGKPGHIFHTKIHFTRMQIKPSIASPLNEVESFIEFENLVAHLKAYTIKSHDVVPG